MFWGAHHSTCYTQFIKGWNEEQEGQVRMFWKLTSPQGRVASCPSLPKTGLVLALKFASLERFLSPRPTGQVVLHVHESQPGDLSVSLQLPTRQTLS